MFLTCLQLNDLTLNKWTLKRYLDFNNPMENTTSNKHCCNNVHLEAREEFQKGEGSRWLR